MSAANSMRYREMWFFRSFVSGTLALWFAGSSAIAAAVVSAEYYVDADPGAGNGVPLTLATGDSLAAAFIAAQISLSGRTSGTHDVGVRVKDDQGVWSNAIIKRFTLIPGDFQLAGNVNRAGDAAQITTVATPKTVSAEYYVDADPGVGSGVPLTLATGDSLAAAFTAAQVALNGRTPGTHDVGVRVKDDQGVWSNAIIKRFTLAPGDFQLAGNLNRTGDAGQTAIPNIRKVGFIEDNDGDGVSNGLEYYMGTAPDRRSLGMEILSGGAGSLTIAHPLARTLDAALTARYEWSSDLLSWHQSEATNAQGMMVKILAGVLDGAEAQAAAQVMSGAAQRLFLRLNVNLAGNPVNYQNWIASDFPELVGEYFVGSDPGQGRGIPLTVAQNGSLASAFDAAQVSIAGLSPGTYEVGLRVQDKKGHWGNAIIKRFTLFSLF